MIKDAEAAREQEIAAWLGAKADQTIETSCARVFLVGESAFKVKRPVDFGFLDYSTLELRRWSLQRELSFNRAAAPDIYRAVRQLTRSADGGIEIDGQGEVVEYALEMRRFDGEAVLASQPWAIDDALEESLGRTIAQFHAGAALRPQGGGVSALGYTIASNANLLRGLASRLGGQAVERLVEETDLALKRLGPQLDARAAEGFARHCHGDLHLGNILIEDGKPILFDCIEFNDALSDIDVQYDLAFLLMDLDFRRRRDAAGRVLNAYLDEAARTFGEGLWTGLAALPLMLSVRAAVRTHVWAYTGDDEAARAYLATAIEHLAPKPVSLVATGGLSGSGKSTFARVCAPGLGAAPGAVVLRTDEIRKRLWNAPTLQRLPKEAYTSEVSDKVYDELFRDAELVLRAGRSVVVDAVFIKPEQRARAEALAKKLDVAFQGVWLEAPAEVLRARVAARVNDASDADVAVLESQLVRDTGEIDWRRVDTVSAFEDEARALAEQMG
ncbi:gluconate kinase [Caulobacter sp. D4A]|uniref:bifunctional aminoglycoside phosphotransferase/ATP-binding protein n=1 Tax=unclassified Caulobacter TaxID=2648921 RepID=UPI000D72B9FA|nr:MULTISPECIES: bifunctional aminoglycoside phosphotransferase/ATP-binding protein [unclassified Caulobacter]PXA86274.1 gluconate kinase [Caulobacter sp. D5]PXA93927.1 gluconate kinase [Caulobacter sp. D4A]